MPAPGDTGGRRHYVLNLSSVHSFIRPFIRLLPPSTPVCWLSDSGSRVHQTLGDRAFPVAAALARNSLPPAVRDAPSLLSFRSRLKTCLFELTLAWHWLHSPAALHFVCDFSNSVKYPCNVTHDSVTLIFTFLIIIITKLVITMFWKQMIASFDASWHKWSAAQRHETVHFGGQEVKDKGLVFGGHEVKDKGHVRQEIDLKAWQSRHSQPACVEQLF